MSKKNRKRRSSAASAVEAPKQSARVVARPRVRLPTSSPGAVGAYLGMVFGLGLFGLGVGGKFLSDPLPTPLVLALCLGGALEVVLCWRTLVRSRVAWSFATSLSGTVALICLFGAPKIRDEL